MRSLVQIFIYFLIFCVVKEKTWSWWHCFVAMFAGPMELRLFNCGMSAIRLNKNDFGYLKLLAA